MYEKNPHFRKTLLTHPLTAKYHSFKIRAKSLLLATLIIL